MPRNAPEPSPGTALPALRADARRNRERLLVAAHSVFTEHGASASMDDVARRAKVGIGTLYRHFPTREALLAAACNDRLLALAAAAADQEREGVAPIETFRWFIEGLVGHATMYRGMAASLGVVLASGTGGCDATTRAGQRLLQAAKRAKQVRKDVCFEDVVCMATAVSIAASSDPAGARRVPRLVALFMNGLSRPSSR